MSCRPTNCSTLPGTNEESVQFCRDLLFTPSLPGGRRVRRGRLINPDKYFHWKLLAVAERAYFVDRPSFAYRWHEQNQNSIQASGGSLKYLVDEYTSTLELDEARPRPARNDPEALSRRHGRIRRCPARVGHAGAGNRVRARRTLEFGWAVYPDSMRQSRNARILSTLLRLGPIGERIAKRAYARYLDKAKS